MAKKLKLKGTAKSLIVISIIAVLICSMFFIIILPVLNNIYNPLPNADGESHYYKEILSLNGLPDDDPVSTEPPDENIQIGEDTFTKTVNLSGLVKPGTLSLMLIGVDNPNEGRFDTMVICNIDKDEHVIKLISIPRDTYVPYSDSVIDALKKNFYTMAVSKGAYKLNATYNVGNYIKYTNDSPFPNNSGMNFFHDTLKSFYGIDFSDYVYVNFDGFMELVDIVGGVDITVDRDIRNASGEMILAQGEHHVDGNQALMYARHRYLYDQYGNPIPTAGDSYRKQNQLKMLMEISRQVATVDNINKTPQILNSLRKNVFHSDITKYIPIALDFSKGKYQIQSYLVTGVDIDPLNDNASYVLVK